MTQRSSGTAETFMTARPRFPLTSFIPPSRRNGACAGANTDRSADSAATFVQASSPEASSTGFLHHWRKPSPRIVFTSSCRSPASSSSLIRKGIPPATSNAFTSALPLGYIRVSNGTTSDSSAMSCQSITMPAIRAMATRWML